jgi:sigma-B regulation protein RsbU (phosphoserine phosphatase)
MVILLAIPALLAVGGLSILRQGRPDPRRQAAELAMEAALNQVEAGKEPLTHFSTVFRRVEARVFRRVGSPATAWPQEKARLDRRYPGLIDGLLLDADGLPVAAADGSALPRRLTQKFAQAIRDLHERRQPLPPVVTSFIRSTFGPAVATDLLVPGQLVYAAPPPAARYLYISRPRPAGLLVLRLSPPGHLHDLALRDVVAAVNRNLAAASPPEPSHAGPLRLAIAWAGHSGRALLHRLQMPAERFGEVWPAMIRSPTGMVWIGSRLLARRLLHPSAWVVGRLDLPPASDLPLAWPLAAYLGLLAILGWLRHPWLTGLSAALTGSVRIRLAATFLYALLVPVLGMGLIAGAFVANRRDALEAAVHEQRERALRSFDLRFRTHLHHLGARLRRRLFPPGDPPPDGLQAFLDRFASWRDEFRFDFCRVYDRHGMRVFGYDDPAASFLPRNAEIFFGRLARSILLQTEVEAARPGQPPRRRAELPIPLEAVYFDELETGPFHNFLFYWPLGTQADQPTHMAFLVWNRKRMERNYVQSELPRLARQLGEGEIFAWSPTGKGPSWPPAFRQARLVAPFLREVTTSSPSYRRRVPGGEGQSWLLTGVRGTNLANYSLLSLITDREIQATLADLAWYFRFVAGSLLLLGALIASLVARTFLVPLQRLTGAVTAVAARRFDHRLPPGGDDELGRLGELFNTALASLSDLEVARTVQAHLFPAAPLARPHFVVVGSTRTAAQVGGDFYDYGPDRAGTGWRLLIGDVAGHGVGAALVVALAKTVLGHPGTPPEPTAALRCLHERLLAILQRRKMLTCLLGWLSAEGDRLHLAAAGQTWPLVVRAGTANYLPLSSLPLGSRARWTPGTATLDLQPGDAVVLYSDGLVEAADQNGNPIGYERWRRDLPGLLRENAVATEAAISAWHRALAPADPPADDVTVVVLQRPAAPTPAADSQPAGSPGDQPTATAGPRPEPPAQERR